MSRARQGGFSLVELLVAMVLGMMVLSGITSIYVSTVKSSADTLKSSKLNTQLMTIMSVMSNDIRRAGFWGNFTSQPTLNPFNQLNDTALVIINNVSSDTQITANADTDGQCVLFAYDENENGIVDAATEYFGFRLNAGVAQMRAVGTVTDGDSCNNGVWLDLSDSDLYTITQLTFNPKNSRCIDSSEPNGIDDDGLSSTNDAEEANCYTTVPASGSGVITVETREIEITLAGMLNKDTDVTMAINQSVRVRNDLIRVR
ncbi:PilW family protein [Thalassotalea litorea]|uniref:PilW family protein n=1 Tax=Thalassotalea litorea TaxID=2020715 RepID=UPI003734F13A